MLYDVGSHSLIGWVGNRTLLADEPVQILVVPMPSSSAKHLSDLLTCVEARVDGS